VRRSLFALSLAGVTLWFVLRPPCHAVPERRGITGVTEHVGRHNGWEVRADATRPQHVFYLIDPKQRDPSTSLSFLRTTGPEWEGVVRVEVIRTLAGEVDPVGGFVWDDLWFYGDQAMLDRIRPGQ
jgi:hypothetical protein